MKLVPVHKRIIIGRNVIFFKLRISDISKVRVVNGYAVAVINVHIVCNHSVAIHSHFTEIVEHEFYFCLSGCIIFGNVKHRVIFAFDRLITREPDVNIRIVGNKKGSGYAFS